MILLKKKKKFKKREKVEGRGVNFGGNEGRLLRIMVDNCYICSANL